LVGYDSSGVIAVDPKGVKYYSRKKTNPFFDLEEVVSVGEDPTPWNLRRGPQRGQILFSEKTNSFFDLEEVVSHSRGEK
jgi:hypothetical protein